MGFLDNLLGGIFGPKPPTPQRGDSAVRPRRTRNRRTAERNAAPPPADEQTPVEDPAALAARREKTLAAQARHEAREQTESAARVAARSAAPPPPAAPPPVQMPYQPYGAQFLPQPQQQSGPDPFTMMLLSQLMGATQGIQQTQRPAPTQFVAPTSYTPGTVDPSQLGAIEGGQFGNTTGMFGTGGGGGVPVGGIDPSMLYALLGAAQGGGGGFQQGFI